MYLQSGCFPPADPVVLLHLHISHFKFTFQYSLHTVCCKETYNGVEECMFILYMWKGELEGASEGDSSPISARHTS